MEQAETEERRTSDQSSHRDRSGATQMQQTRPQYSGRTYAPVISDEARYFGLLAVAFVILLMSGVTLIGGTWLFAPLYVGVAIFYVAGSLYLFKKLMTH